MVNQDVAERLVAFFVPMMALWLLVGVAVAVLYHLSLYILDAEFRVGSERALDLFVAVLRGLAFILVWPVIFYFDRTALTKIKLMVLYFFFPREREENAELRCAIRERDYRIWVRRWALDQQELHEKRDDAARAREREKRLRVVAEGSPELDHIWMLTGRGSTSAGTSELVGLYPDYYGVDEVRDRARFEVSIRRPWMCLRCRTALEPEVVEVPELTWLRIVEPGTARTVVEGWAVQGQYRQTFPECPKCGKEQPEMAGDLATLGLATDIVRSIREGLNVHADLP
jgi:hypothetical protein